MYKQDTYTGNVIKIDTGKVVAPTSDPEDPDYLEYHQWASDGGIPEHFSSYIESGQALMDEQKRVWELIKKERERRRYESVLVEGNWFHTDTDSRVKYEHLIKAGENLKPESWKVKSPGGGLFNPIFVQMNYNLLVKIVSAITQYESKVFTAAEMHRIKMLADQDPASYNYAVDWPQTFSDLYPE